MIKTYPCPVGSGNVLKILKYTRKKRRIVKVSLFRNSKHDTNLQACLLISLISSYLITEKKHQASKVNNFFLEN